MIRFGSITAQVERVRATLRGTRDAIAGSVTITITPWPDGRAEAGTGNAEVLRHLVKRNPGLLEGLDAVARAAAREGWRGIRSTLASAARDAGRGFKHELARRLRSGDYVSNTPETRARKARLGHSTTPGVETGQLADALDRANVEVE